MSETFTARIPAGENEMFAPDAFDRMIGKRLWMDGFGRGPVKSVVRRAEVTEDGSAVFLTLEAPDGTLPSPPLSGYSIGKP